MALTRNQLKNLTKEEVIEECLKWSKISTQLDNIEKEFTALKSELKSTKSLNRELEKRIVSLEIDQLKTSQYQRKECLELNPINEDIEDENLESLVCKALSLTGIPVSHKMIHACHRLKGNRAIVKFISRKDRDNIYAKRMILKEKSKELKSLGFNDGLYICESLSNANKNLFYKCRTLKKSSIVDSTWFFNNVINIRLTPSSRIVKIFHNSDIEKLIKVDNIDDYLSNLN